MHSGRELNFTEAELSWCSVWLVLAMWTGLTEFVWLATVVLLVMKIM